MADTQNTNNSNQNNEISVELVEKVSKAGNAYTALQINIGEYNTMVFPSPVEQLYIAHILGQDSK